jgi:hypothetical protein
MRAPVAAWRKLFAVGGAPAASHVVLSRAPSAERLLDPLRGAGVVHSASLDALTKSLDVSDLFARVAGVAVGGEAEPSAVGEGSGAGGECTREPVRVAVREAETAGAGARHPSGDASASIKPMPRAKRATMIMRDLESARTPRSSASIAAHEPSRVKSQFRHAGQGIEATRPVMNKPSIPSDATLSAGLPSDAQAGANARVVLGAPVAGIERLLAIEEPTRRATDVSPRAATNASGSDNDRNSAKPKTVGAESDIATLLSAAVSRAQRAAPTSMPDALSTRRSSQLETRSGARDSDAPRNDGLPGASLVADAPASVGFRGLAQRTLTHSQSTTHAPIKRLEAEKHVSADIMHDTLDARVADSLARVLEREVRRHGIDIDEARA